MLIPLHDNDAVTFVRPRYFIQTVKKVNCSLFFGLTCDAGSNEADSVVGSRAGREEGLDQVVGESQSDDGLASRLNDHQ